MLDEEGLALIYSQLNKYTQALSNAHKEQVLLHLQSSNAIINRNEYGEVDDEFSDSSKTSTSFNESV